MEDGQEWFCLMNVLMILLSDEVSSPLVFEQGYQPLKVKIYFSFLQRFIVTARDCYSITVMIHAIQMVKVKLTLSDTTISRQQIYSKKSVLNTENPILTLWNTFLT